MKNKPYLRLLSLLLLPLLLLGCSPVSPTEDVTGGAQNGNTDAEDGDEKTNAIYVHITPSEAKALMYSEKDYIILDVRTQEEYEKGHIPGAILAPYDEIETRAGELLPDRDVMLLVYCRSGRRSKIAAEALQALGYTDIREFGGIIDWPYEIEK